MTWPVPTPQELAEYTGRPLTSYTSYVNSALLQAAMMFTILSELGAGDYAGMQPDFQQLANMGIMAMADYLYLRWPYAQALASPMQSETIGSYSYSKPVEQMARNAQAIEVNSEKTGVDMFDLAVRRLARRQAMSGVFFGQITGFERRARSDEVWIGWDKHERRMVLTGPADRDQYDFPGGWAVNINAESFPADPA
jgi:hypothetical protein